MEKNKTGKYFKYAIGEIILVVIGILIALSINNWSQKKSERKIEQNYLFSLIEDAKTDLSNFKNIISINEQRIANLDSFAFRCYNYNVKEEKDAELMLWYMYSLAHPDFITQTDRTLSQLKNSGGMRLIEDKTKIDAIIKYEESFEKLYNQQIWYEGGLKDLLNAGVLVFNLKYLPKPNKKFDQETFFKTARLLDTDKRLITELGNRAINYNLLTASYLSFLEEGKQECIKLIDVLENKDTTDLKE
ncbi:DUF6090 family protein [Psychroserpens jangbogonensis]|uniref:DUF6090 family protein n=1 Tax=Psychroserpens jangbogonensis TaxID=1484460 RepID=UPI00068F13E6|nr:DUF6090 family protein [Psychroserpens jangbogonensis]